MAFSSRKHFRVSGNARPSFNLKSCMRSRPKIESLPAWKMKATTGTLRWIRTLGVAVSTLAGYMLQTGTPQFLAPQSSHKVQGKNSHRYPLKPNTHTHGSAKWRRQMKGMQSAVGQASGPFLRGECRPQIRSALGRRCISSSDKSSRRSVLTIPRQ
jgi:hypothetical protein